MNNRAGACCPRSPPKRPVGHLLSDAEAGRCNDSFDNEPLAPPGWCVFGVPPEAKDKVLPLLDKGAALMRAM